MDDKSDLLYKVSAPRSDLTFEPRPFWRNEDWTESSRRPRDGYVEEVVVYAGAFDAVSIHLLPKVWRLRVTLTAAAQPLMHDLGYVWPTGSRALIFFREEDSDVVWRFRPTVFAFAREGFEPIPSNEFVSRVPVRALGSETLSMSEAIERWAVHLIPVAQPETLVSALTERGIRFSVQR
jgi:hypothetical protein